MGAAGGVWIRPGVKIAKEAFGKLEAGEGLASDIIFFFKDEQDMILVPKERLPGGGESSSELLDVGKTGCAGRRWKQHTPGGRDVKGKAEEAGRPGSHMGILRRTSLVGQEWGKQPQQEEVGMSVTVTSGGGAW